MDLSDKERLIVGTLLHEVPSPLPEMLAKVLWHAPESFLDERLGTIAVTIREMELANKPVAPVTVRSSLSDGGRLDKAGGALFFDTIDSSAVTIPIADFEAADVWQAYVERQTESTLNDGLSALRSQPSSATVIVKGIIKSLERVATNGSNGPKTLSVRRPDELLAMEFDDRDILLGDRLLEKGGSLVIAGAGGIGKSRLALQLAVANIMGREFVTLQTRGYELKWLILQSEDSNRRLNFDFHHLKEWCANRWPQVNDQLVIHTLENDGDAFLSLDDPQNFSRLADLISKVNPDVIVFDNLSNFAIGNLTQDADMRATCEAISRLTKQGNPLRACVVLHHALTGKAGASRAVGFERASFGRNSKVLLAWTRGQINLSPRYPHTNETVVVSCGKCSNGREFAPFAARLNPKTMIYEPDASFDLSTWQADMAGQKADGPSVTVDTVIGACKGTMTKKELVRAIMDETGCGKSLAYRKIEDAQRAKRLH